MEMAQIELDQENVGMLRETLSNHLADLRLEFANTDDREFREYLKKRIEFLEQFIRTLDKESGAVGKELAPKPVAIALTR
jgi:flagellin-specific chaperone FliS